MKKKAIVLLSGGLDSTTCLAIAKSQGYECYALSFDYGQRHNPELKAAALIAKFFGVKEHKIIKLDALAEIGHSALTDHSIAVPEFTGKTDIPITYVPARNTIFLTMSLAWAEVLDVFDIFIGANAVDYSGYPDCRPEYYEAFQKMADIATKAGIEGKKLKIHTPLINLTKAEIIQLGLNLDVDYRMTISCYQANEHGHACGRCDSCTYRKKGFSELASEDLTLYQAP